jgi:hypothetical protein
LITTSILRWLASSLLLALFVVEHVRLAWRARAWWSLLVPIAPVMLALQRGERVAPTLSMLVALAWIGLRLTA